MAETELIDLRRAAQASLQAGRFDDALSTARLAVEQAPEDIENLYLAGVAARYAKKFDLAQSYIDTLKALQPEFGRAWQEDGHRLRDLGDLHGALTAYQRACQYNPALEASFRAQAAILAQLGRNPEAQAANAQADRLKGLPRHVLAVTNHLAEGRHLKAEDICRAYLKQFPQDTEAMRLLAEIGVRLGVLEDAEVLLREAVRLDPEAIQIRLDYISILRKRQKFADALREAEALHKRDPTNPLFASHLAIERMQTGDYETALRLFDGVLETLPNDPATLTSRGHALKTAGNQAEAIRSYKSAINAQPGHGDAWYALANLKTYTFSDSELSDMLAAETRPDISHAARTHLCFALAKAHEDRNNYETAFAFYERGNQLKLAQTRYTTEQMRDEFAAQRSACTKALFEVRKGVGFDAPDPIFILGLPRAGSTLIEQILASHSQVDGTLELPNILATAHALRGRRGIPEEDRYPASLHKISSDQLTELGRTYVENTRIHRQGAPFFTDKMPNNFRHIGLIHLILPNAKIIDARRNPMDCCWSAYKQLFAEGQEFTYSLDDIGNYYSEYVDLMEHWERVLPPGCIHRVQHEELLDDTEGEVKRLLTYLGLPFEPACLDFYKTDRAVRTASSEQVRQPINRSGQDQWKPYEPWLEPLKNALGS